MITGDEISKLIWSAEEGNLDALQCPQCHKSAISVSFTHPAADAYRVYFDCSSCAFRMSGRRRGKPSHFSEDRIDPDRQAFDVEVLRTMKFPLPVTGERSQNNTMVRLLLKSWAIGLLLTLFVDGLRLFGNHALAAPSLLLVPPFFMAGWITNKGRWDYFEDTELYFLTILFGSLLYGLIALPMVRHWTRKNASQTGTR
jgi:hypothetical protein